VAFAEGREGKDVTEGVPGHRRNGFYCEYLVGRISYLANDPDLSFLRFTLHERRFTALLRFTTNASRLLQKVELDT
jgi:hypothetical protein